MLETTCNGGAGASGSGSGSGSPKALRLPVLVKISSKGGGGNGGGSSSPRAVGLCAPVSFWKWVSTKRKPGFVKTLNGIFFGRLCSAKLLDRPEIEEKIAAVCKKVYYRVSASVCFTVRACVRVSVWLVCYGV